MSGLRVLCLVLFIVVFLWAGGCTTSAIFADYDYSNHVQSFWDLSVKASTIQQKSVYLDKYVEALKAANLADSDALWLKTPDNNTAENLHALESLQGRMHEIINMDPNSFQYQQAMQQITGQEQDEARNMLGRFEGAWYLQHHFLLWDWVGVIHGLLVGILLLSAVIGFFVVDDY